MTRLLVLSFLFPALAQASALKAVTYKTVKCELTHGDKVVKAVESTMMPLVIEENIGRFIQLQLGDQKLKIQYQLLLEDDLKNAGNIIVLQNLLVGKNEVSAEFSASELKWVRTVGQDYSVKCEIFK
ncbi:hypothetical protein D3C87_1308170 [compost metagenome]